MCQTHVHLRHPDAPVYPLLAGGCIAACPVREDGAPCLKTCTKPHNHYGPHTCAEGHSWR